MIYILGHTLCSVRLEVIGRNVNSNVIIFTGFPIYFYVIIMYFKTNNIFIVIAKIKIGINFQWQC